MQSLEFLAIGVTITALLLLVGHWFPWRKPLTRVEAYIYGVVSIFVGFAIGRLMVSDWITPAWLGAVCVGGGLAVLGAYGIDRLFVLIDQAHRAESDDDELQE